MTEQEPIVDYCPNCGETHAIGYDCARDFEMSPDSLGDWRDED